MARMQGPAMLTVGVLVFLVALTADRLGLGTSPGLGAVQLASAAAGVVLAVIGMRLLRRPHGS